MKFREKSNPNPCSMNICHAGDCCDYTETGKAFLSFLAVASKKLTLVGDKHVSNSNYDTYMYTTVTGQRLK